MTRFFLVWSKTFDLANIIQPTLLFQIQCLFPKISELPGGFAPLGASVGPQTPRPNCVLPHHYRSSYATGKEEKTWNGNDVSFLKNMNINLSITWQPLRSLSASHFPSSQYSIQTEWTCTFTWVLPQSYYLIVIMIPVYTVLLLRRNCERFPIIKTMLIELHYPVVSPFDC